MKAAVFTELRKIELKDRPKPEIQSDDVLVKVEYCGICGSDLHGYLDGIFMQVGSVMGHECSGMIAEVGDGVQNFQSGDRVGIKPIPQCGECYWCRKGQTMLCPKAWERCIGIHPAIDGAYAEFLRVQHPNEMLFKLPSNVSFQEAALIEPLATSLHSVRISRFKLGDCVVIIGAGPIGLGVVQFLKMGGAGTIIVLEISPKRSQIAQKLGADVVLNPEFEGEGLTDKILSFTHGIGADIVFEAAGVPFSFQNAMNFMRGGGQVIVVGVNFKEVSVNPSTVVLKEAEIKGALTYSDDDYKHVIEFLDQKRINTKLLISDIISLDEIEEKGFKRLLSSPDAVKVLVRP